MRKQFSVLCAITPHRTHTGLRCSPCRGLNANFAPPLGGAALVFTIIPDSLSLSLSLSLSHTHTHTHTLYIYIFHTYRHDLIHTCVCVCVCVCVCAHSTWQRIGNSYASVTTPGGGQ